MPVKEKSRDRSSEIGMPKRKNREKGCRRRRKAGIEQARSACQKEKIEEKECQDENKTCIKQAPQACQKEKTKKK